MEDTFCSECPVIARDRDEIGHGTGEERIPKEKRNKEQTNEKREAEGMDIPDVYTSDG
jgi:hypothetical protein